VAARRAVTAVALLAALGAAAGCGNAVEGLAQDTVERAIENELGSTADVQVDGDSFTVDTEDGSVTAGSGTVPDGFPADVPLVDGDITFSQTATTDGKRGWTVQVTTTGEPDEVASAVADDLTAAGFEVENLPADASATVIAERADLSSLVLVAADPSGTVVVYTVDQK
jgi:hypothetical protein